MDAFGHFAHANEKAIIAIAVHACKAAHIQVVVGAICLIIRESRILFYTCAARKGASDTSFIDKLRV